MVTYDVKLNIVPNNIPTVVHVKQYQTDATIRFWLYASPGTLNIGTVTACTVRGTKLDKNGYSATATYNSSNQTVSFKLTTQMTAIVGKTPFEICITDSTGKMITRTFWLYIERAAMDQDTVSGSVITELANALSHTNEVLTARNEVITNRDRIRTLASTGFTIFTDPNDDGNIVITNATL